MWCDNCLLIFPLRAGAIVLCVIMALYQIGGGVFLFKFGEYYFTIYPEASIYGGYAMAQGSLAVIAMIGFSNRSYLFSRLLLVTYPFIIILGAVRGGVMTWELKHFSDRIEWTCSHGGVKWSDRNKEYIPPSLYDNPFCKAGIETFSAIFTMCLVIDFIFMCYFYFLVWRFNVKLQHYPYQKNEIVYP